MSEAKLRIFKEGEIVPDGEHPATSEIIGPPRDFTYIDGSRYHGTFANGVSPFTNESMVEPLDDSGKKSRCGVQHGEGRMEWAGENEKAAYQGEWDTNQATGQGNMEWADGTMYKGQWKAHKMHGKGKYYMSGVCELPVGNSDGTWENGAFVGKGRVSWNDDREWYEGEIKGNKFNGEGKYEWADGRSYQGQFRDGLMHGQGAYTWTQERRKCQYIGNFQEDVFEGYGECIWGMDSGNEAYYKGEWKDDRMHGHGEYEYANGDTYVGEFRKNKMDGEGTYNWKQKGVSHSGKWKDDHPVTTGK